MFTYQDTRTDYSGDVPFERQQTALSRFGTLPLVAFVRRLAMPSALNLHASGRCDPARAFHFARGTLDNSSVGPRIRT